jgi:hypothetical protein
MDALSVDDLSELASVGPEVSVLVDDLTPAEREAFAMLLERELRRLP